MFRIAEIELEMENTIGITLETGVGVQSAILHVCQEFFSAFLVHVKPLRTYRRDVNPVETDTKGRLFVVDVSRSVNWPCSRN